MATFQIVPMHESMRPPPDSGFIRIDDALLSGEYQALAKDHAIHDTLNGVGMVEIYEIYKHDERPEVHCVIRFGSSLNGHPGIVHGGITALLFDNTFGWLFVSLKIPKAVTANLNINYRYV